MHHLHAGKDVVELADRPTPFGKQKEGAGLRHWAVVKANGESWDPEDSDASNHFACFCKPV